MSPSRKSRGKKALNGAPYFPCLPELTPSGTYRDFFSHADLAEVGFHARAHLPDDGLSWLGLERPLPGMQFVPDGAVGRLGKKGDVSLRTLYASSL